MQTFRAYLQLIRLPAVFTAMADVFLGFLLVRRELQPTLGFVMLLTASSCLYLAGMVFNDVFDRKTDARERPHRPIPSGRVSVIGALRLGILLVLAGLGAAQTAGPQSLLVAAALTVMIFAYDGFLKGTPLGPVAMGLCRFFNVLLGASYLDPEAQLSMYISWTTVSLPVLRQPHLPVAAALGVYISGVTWFARQEAGRSSKVQLAGATAVINAGLLGLAVLVYGLPGVWPPWGEARPGGVLITLVLIALVLNRRLFAALRNPVPEKVQPAVRTSLLTLIVLDATIVYYHTASPGYALLTVALIGPALLLGRWVYVT